MRSIAACSLFALAISAPAFGQLINADFESGNTGFTSAYSYRTVSSSPYTGQYGVVNSSFAWSGDFWNTLNADHTTGHGLYLIADTAPGLTIWQETLSVVPGQDYTFGAWLATWTSFPAATVAVEINGTLLANWLGPAGVTWTQHTIGWNSGPATSATIRLYASTNVQPGGDVGIDDITFVPAPASVSVAVGALGLAARRRRR